MRFYFSSIIGAACVAMAMSSAHAADFPVAAYKSQSVDSVYNWSGWHIGVNVGGGMGFNGQDIAGSNANGVAVVGTGAVPNYLKTNPYGFVGGLQVGYDQQFGRWVLGLEADFQGSTIKGSDSNVLSGGPLNVPISLTTNGESGVDWYGTIRGRVGFTPADRLLLFVTGGGAYGKISDKTSITLVAPAPFGAQAIGNYDATKFGYTVGAGMEYGLTRNITLRMQYDYLDFGSHSTGLGAVVGGPGGFPVAFTSSRKDDFHTVRLGANWKM